MLNKDQNQNASDRATAIQVGRDLTVSNGLSYSEVKEVALDVFRANFYKLSDTAEKIARLRAEEITEEFLSKLQRENPSGFQQSENPDFQYALFTMQKEYARNGDKELGDLLVDLLVDRSKQEQRNILQIVLNESLNIAPKLTNCHLATLAVIFSLKYTRTLDLTSHEKLGAHWDMYVTSFIDKITTSISSYQHLEFSGCGSISLAENTLESILRIMD